MSNLRRFKILARIENMEKDEAIELIASSQ